MGDAAHQLHRSDHNLGNAIDLTHDPIHGLDADRLAAALVAQMMHATAGRLSYVIRARRIASATRGWTWREYLGENPHLTHVHLSIRADARDILRPWSLP